MVVVRALTLEPDSLGLYLPLTSSMTLSKLPYLRFPIRKMEIYQLHRVILTLNLWNNA